MELDLRNLDLEARCQRLLASFAELPRGRGLVFLAAGEAQALLDCLQGACAGEFEWYLLEERPGHTCGVLAKRPAGAPRRRQVLEFMENDHRRIHQLLGRIVEAAHADDRPALAVGCTHLRTGLERHFHVEEEVLLPVIAERMGSPRGPALVLREEHIHIAQLVDELLTVSTAVPPSGVNPLGPHVSGAASTAAPAGAIPVAELVRRVATLQELLVNHSGMEERILYAVTDLLLSEDERDELVRRCQRV